MTMGRRIRLRAEDGQGMVEFAMVLPILMLLLLGIVQFGVVFSNYETLTDAGRVAARKAAIARIYGDNGASARQAAKDAAADLDLTDAEIDIQSCPAGTAYPCTTQDWSHPGSEVTVKLTYPYSLSILDFKVAGGTLTTVTKERLE
jgi:Flp pilus assembly protein TadG